VSRIKGVVLIQSRKLGTLYDSKGDLADIIVKGTVNREVKHDVNGRRQTAKITSDFESFSSKP